MTHCPFCESSDVNRIDLYVYECESCGEDFDAYEAKDTGDDWFPDDAGDIDED